jgi:precorrin-2 dehydrogenase / sirohydrochlorin ferrochelatase
LDGSFYPIALNLQDKPCVVVGGGALAAEKVVGLLRSGAEVSVISPTIGPELRQLAETRRIRSVSWRSYHADDLDGAYLAYGASENRELNSRVAADARERGVLVNAVDDIPNCDFFAVSIVRRGDLQIAISTNGLSPAFARWMREYLDEQLPAEFGDLLAVLADVRRAVRSSGKTPPYERWRAAITDDVLELLRVGDGQAARTRILETLTDLPESEPVLHVTRQEGAA